MMLPLVRRQALWLALRSLRSHRQRAVAVFTGAHLVVWVAFGAIAIALLGPVRGASWADAVALAAAAVWQRAAPRRRLLAVEPRSGRPLGAAHGRSRTGRVAERWPARAASARAGR